jgi:hypothetical protein
MSGISGADIQGFGELFVGVVVAGAALSTRLAALRAEKATNRLTAQNAKAAAEALANSLAFKKQQAEIALVAEKAADLVAARAETVALQAAEAARLLVISNRAAAEAAANLGKKIDVVHTIVNSTLTQAMQDVFDSSQHELEIMLQIGSTNEARIAVLRTRLLELRNTISERNKAAANLPPPQGNKTDDEITDILTR